MLEIRQNTCEDQDQDGGDDVGDVGDQLREDRRDLSYPEDIGSHRDRDDEHEPEHQLTEDGRRSLTRLGAVEELLYATPLHPAVETHRFENSGDNGLEYLGHDVADDEDDDRTDELRYELEERTKTLL